MSEDDDSVILRLFETAGRRVETPIVMFGQRHPFREANLLEEPVANSERKAFPVSPFEIKTVRLSVAGLKPR